MILKPCLFGVTAVVTLARLLGPPAFMSDSHPLTVSCDTTIQICTRSEVLTIKLKRILEISI